MVVILLLVPKRAVMGEFTASWPVIVPGWVAAGMMGAAAVTMLLPV